MTETKKSTMEPLDVIFGETNNGTPSKGKKFLAKIHCFIFRKIKVECSPFYDQEDQSELEK